MTGKSGRKRSVGGLIGSGQELQSESLLWRAVLGQAIRDVYDGNEKIRHQVLMWTATTDFLTVCDYAYVHPEDMREQLHALCELSPNLAKKYGRMLRETVVAGS